MSGCRAAFLLAAMHRDAEREKEQKKKGTGHRRETRREKQKVKRSSQEMKKRNVLDAVALQDHLVRQLDFSKNSFRMLRRGRRRSEGCESNWTCHHCTLINVASAQTCEACDSGRRKVDRTTDVTDIGYRPPKLTLAQRRGLVAPPPAKLTASEWLAVEMESRTKRYSNDVCPICIETFKLDTQVILSCGHVRTRSNRASSSSRARYGCATCARSLLTPVPICPRPRFFITSV